MSPPWCAGSTTLLLSLALLLPGSARADVPANELSVGAALSQYSSYLRGAQPHPLLELAYDRRLGAEGFASAVAVGAGLRGALVGFPDNRFITVPLEGFVTLRLRARLGWWEMAAGPEVGVTGRARLATPPKPFPEPGGADAEQARLSPVYVGMALAPLRVHVGRFLASALELRVASGFSSDSALRLDVGLLRLGVSL